MIKSMTGFGRGTIEDAGKSFVVEIKSVNHRYLDLNIKMPRSLISLEESIRKIISSKINRGKVDVFITQNSFSTSNVVATLNEELANSYLKCLQDIKNKYVIKDDISVSLLARFPDVITLNQEEVDLEKVWLTLNIPLNEAIESLIDMRVKEGLKLRDDILKRCKYIQEMVHKISEKSPVVIKEYRDRLEKRLKELIEDSYVDENRIAMEIAIYTDKCNIDEEIVRLNSHIVQLTETLDMDEPIGRKLDFIVQEMNRETNTIASKSNDLEIVNTVLNIKNEIEKIREQIQNVE